MEYSGQGGAVSNDMEQRIARLEDAVISIKDSLVALVRLEAHHTETREALSRAFKECEKLEAKHDALTAAGYTMSEYNDMASGNGWGPVLPGSNGIECNLYDCENLHESLQQYVVPAPLTPNNIRAGDAIQTVYRCVVVADAIRDLCRALVVQLAGPTHAEMWSVGLSADGSAPATHYINSGLVRVELAAMLDDAAALAAGTGIDLAQAQYILSQADVSAEDPLAVMARRGLEPVL